MPLISVIIPVYNGEKTIKQTIESVLNQTFKDFELIVINDGSTDTTLEIASSIQDTRIKVFSYPNTGPNHSRNRGISLSYGEYISFLDADDLWTPDKLEAQLKALQENSQAAVAYSWTNYIDESGKFIRAGSYQTINGDIFGKLLLIDFIENGSNPLIRKQALIEVGSFDESLAACQDWDMWLRLAEHYHFVAVPSPQILYRISLTSWSSKVSRMEASSLVVLGRIFNRCASLQHLKRQSFANRFKCLTFSALERSSEPYRGLIAARCFWRAIKYDPALLKTRVFWKVLFKIAAVSLLPPQIAVELFANMKQFSNISSIVVNHTQI